MKKLVVAALLCGFLLEGCAQKEIEPTLQERVEAIIPYDDLLNKYSMTEVDSIIEIDDNTVIINGYSDGGKLSYVFNVDNLDVIMSFNPDTSEVWTCDFSETSLMLLSKYTSLDLLLFHNNAQYLEVCGFRDWVNLASRIGNNKVVTVDGDDVIADGITYHVDKSTGDFTTSKNSIDMSAYSPLIYSAYFKTFNTSTFTDITGITVPISVSDVESSLKEWSSEKSLTAVLTEDSEVEPVMLDKLDISSGTVNVEIWWNEAIADKTQETLIAENSPLKLTWCPEDYTLEQTTALIGKLGSPNILYVNKNVGNSVTYTAIYRLLDDLAEDSLVLKYTEKLWDTTHVVSDLSLSYCNSHYMNERQSSFGTKFVYSSSELMKEISNYAR